MPAADPPYLSALKGEFGVTKMGWFQSYKKAYIDKSAFRPIIHIVAFTCCIGYLMEFSHLKRERRPPLLAVSGPGLRLRRHRSLRTHRARRPRFLSHFHPSSPCCAPHEQTSATRRSASTRWSTTRRDAMVEALII